jgi:uncharacterized protein with HEPN domain
MSERDLLLFVDDIIVAIQKIEEYTNNETFESFSMKNMVIDAVVRNFEIIGEAANNIPKEIQQKYPYVEWKEMIGFRNIIIHDYFGINLKTVWDTVKINIPILKEHIQKMKEDYERANP